MSDKLVFDLSQEVEGTPAVFVRKDWLNILDNQNQNYSNNQSIIDTSQLSNSNKYMSYREAYLLCPLTLTLAQSSIDNAVAAAIVATPSVTTLSAGQNATTLTTGSTAQSMAYSAVNMMGLKNWFGNIVHSLTLDYNGTTIVQQTPYVNMWNSFKLLTSLSMQDVLSQGATIGFYPDDPKSFGFFLNSGAGSALGTLVTALGVQDFLSGNGTVNNSNFQIFGTKGGANNFSTGEGNEGLIRRQEYINFDTQAPLGALPVQSVSNGAYLQYGTSLYNYSSLITAQNCQNLWKSYIYNRQDGLSTIASGQAYTNGGGVYPPITQRGVIQMAVTATIYLKHLHSFFNMCPLLKGVFMKLTLNLNNTSSTIKQAMAVATGATATTVGQASPAFTTGLAVSSVTNALGGVNPLMCASGFPQNGSATIGFTPAGYPANTASFSMQQTLIMNLSVGAKCLDQSITSLSNITLTDSPNAKSIYLYIPSYSFNPVFEQAYLSSPVKQIKYTDIYQYQVLNVQAGGTFNNLITNGIANIKSVLLIPFYNASGSSTSVVTTNAMLGVTNTTNTGLPSGMQVWQSPFDPAGCGCTSPLSHITNFNIQVSGQNAIYNLQKYAFEEFNNQLYGQNAVNGGLTDGLTSGLIDRLGFDMEYCYYYVNVERMLPVEMSVPKSIQVIGTNTSSKTMDYFVFVEYGIEISIDALTGARV
jgi:hypothetical protein